MPTSNPSDSIRHDWTHAELADLFARPLLELVYEAAGVHRAHFDPRQVQVCKLISIKTGACPEDCSYCSQSSRYQTEVLGSPLLGTEEVLQMARRARDAGASRVCMGAAWREVRDNRQFDRVLEMVRGVNALGIEVCCTLGMLTESQARQLQDAGLHAYNHNIDTSEAHYKSIISTRTFEDRLQTIENVRKTDVTVCCGGILGIGEKLEDRIEMLRTLATMNPHPESVPINVLAKVPGTPMADQADVPPWEIVRMIAATRLAMPGSVVRLSAGRARLSISDQALCFMAGANSIFSSETGAMLTLAVPSPVFDADQALFKILGLVAGKPFADHHALAAQGSAAEQEPQTSAVSN